MSRATTQAPRAYDLQNLTAPKLGQRLAGGANSALRGNLRTAMQDGGYRQQLTPAEDTAGLVDADLVFGHEPGHTSRYVDPEQQALIDAGDADSQDASVVTDALQVAHDTYLGVSYPRGIFKTSAHLKLRPWTNISGAGKSQYVDELAEAVTGTRVLQSAADYVFSTDYSGDLDDAFAGHIYISDLTVLGGTSSAQIGTYGFRISSSVHTTLERVQASWFTLSGIRYIGSLRAQILNCEASYNQNAGIALEFGDLGSTETANAYASNIIGGACHQNKNYGILLGASTFKVNIIGVDIESTGTFFSSGLGVGIGITGESNCVTIDGCWLEGNKTHIEIGPTNSLVTVPKNTRIKDCHFGSTSGGGAAIVVHSGRGTVIEGNLFLGSGTIVLESAADNPIIRGNQGNPVVIDASSNPIAIDSKDQANNLASADVSAWTLTNCTVAEEFVASPAGPVPVYKVTPSATGDVRIAVPETPLAFLKARQTIGCYIKTDGANREFAWGVGSTTLSKVYTDATVDNFLATGRWEWHSIGRHIDFADTGNQTISLSVTVTTTDPFYVTGVSSRSGICYDPHKVTDGEIPALANVGTPSVYGLHQARSGGTTSITGLTQGALGQKFTLIAEHSLTVTDGTNLVLAGSVSFSMNATDTLTLIRKSDGKWYEIGRSDNS